GATDDLGIGRPANIGEASAFAPTAPLRAGQTSSMNGSITLLCGDNPEVQRATYWDIATSLRVATSKGIVQSDSAVFRRNWAPWEGGHPCPATQPPLPGN